MTANREIKIYGTLLNATINAAIGDADHNDALGYAYQLYDNRFGEETPIDNFQDIINKRLTAISYADGITTIKNRPGTPDGIPYMFVVEGNSNINGNLKTKNISADDIAAKAIMATDGMTITGDVVVTSGDLSLNNGDLDVDGTASISGATSIGGTLDVIGATHISSPVDINSNLTVAGTSSFGGQMTANGINSAADVTAPNITDTTNPLSILAILNKVNGDKTVDGSFRKAIDDLYQLLMGGQQGQHIDYDTINELANFVVEHKEFAEALEALAQQNKQDIAALQVEDRRLEGRIDTNANDIQDLKDSVLHLGADVENHEERITRLEGTTTDINGRLTTIEEWADLVNLDEIPILRDEVASLRSRVTSVETAIGNINTTIGGMQQSISGLQASVNNLSGGLSSLSNTVNSLASSIQALQNIQYWELSNGRVSAKDGRAVQGAGFYDTTV